MLSKSEVSQPLARPHATPAPDVLSGLSVSSASGLTTEQAALRLKRHGPNILRSRRRLPTWRILLNQFESSVVLLLAAASAIAMAFGEWREGIAIIIVLAINAVIGFVTEVRAVRSMEGLRQLGSRTARVRRDGQVRPLPAQALVPGDIVLLEGGDVVTADLRLIETAALHCDESTLTGESTDVAKSFDPVAAETAMADRTPMAFKGTAVTRGTGLGVVIATGMETELGKISKLVEEAAPESSPLEKRLDRLSRQLIWLTLALAVTIAVVGILRGQDLLLMIEAAIALAVAAIPEGLPIVATMALARGMWRMARRNALIERLAAVETLGATTVIFTDKTGTLTENRMAVARLLLPGGSFSLDPTRTTFVHEGGPVSPDDAPSLHRALEAGVLCNNASLAANPANATGDPMEVALLITGQLAGLGAEQLRNDYPRQAELAFDSETKMMATLHRRDGELLAAIKGAPEAVLANATTISDKDGDRQLAPALRADWLKHVETLAAEGLRVLALASKVVPDGAGFDYRGLTFLGLVAFSDPPRADVSRAIKACREAAVRVVMVTGDHAVTARNIAHQIGLAGETARVIEGRDLKPLADMSAEEQEAVLEADVFARVDPAQKLDLISAYQSSGEIVAMTGDGVNDAPALKKADIGIAMGLRGTQVAREAADIVLRDDAFPTIVVAMREGRVIFDNIRRFVVYLLSCNLAEVLIVGLAILAGLPLPLLPLQILFLNLVTDVFPAFALGAGEGKQDVLNKPPRDPSESILQPRHWRAVVGHGLSIAAATLGGLAVALFWLGRDDATAVTMSFLTLAFAQLWHVFNMRGRTSNPFRNDITQNPFVWGALLLCVAILLSAVYFAPLRDVLRIVPPDGVEWAAILAMSLLPLVIGQIALSVRKRP